jgi:hypothetical protein
MRGMLNLLQSSRHVALPLKSVSLTDNLLSPDVTIDIESATEEFCNSLVSLTLWTNYFWRVPADDFKYVHTASTYGKGERRLH